MMRNCSKTDIRSSAPGRSLHVGITGGIASGKSHVSRFFNRLGCMVLDADQVARQVVRPGCPAYREIIEHFGPGVLTLTGELDRPKLGTIVFTDPEERRVLNSIVHPRVMEETDAWLAAHEEICANAPLFVEAALMVETSYYKKLDSVILVFCPTERQRERIARRDGLTAEQADQRIRSQMPWEEKRKAADFIIDTSGTYRQTLAQTVAIFRQLISTSSDTNRA